MLSFMLNLLMFTLKRKHLLLMLLSLEFIIISLFMLLFIYLSFSFSYYFSFIFMILSVCESVLGLSVLVSMIRFYGNDYFQSFNILW
uniref:NADH-ubiquinone oxidoreductase chain 4L n=1 Tax=Phacomorphus fratyi TaxID=723369 RepID=A0A0S2M818_9COLE|nr:NADH dehydrogenase subunit 4L [Phacomorphus fratyi]ALO70827.1 NADH deshydrogenase subunit 4L [Phacomorphus fratyi]